MSGGDLTCHDYQYNNLYQGRDRYRGDMQDTTATNYTDLLMDSIEKREINMQKKMDEMCNKCKNNNTLCARDSVKKAARVEGVLMRLPYTPSDVDAGFHDEGTLGPSDEELDSFVKRSLKKNDPVYHSMRHEKHASYKIDGMDTMDAESEYSANQDVAAAYAKMYPSDMATTNPADRETAETSMYVRHQNFSHQQAIGQKRWFSQADIRKYNQELEEQIKNNIMAGDAEFYKETFANV